MLMYFFFLFFFTLVSYIYICPILMTPHAIFLTDDLHAPLHAYSRIPLTVFHFTGHAARSLRPHFNVACLLQHSASCTEELITSLCSYMNPLCQCVRWLFSPFIESLVYVPCLPLTPHVPPLVCNIYPLTTTIKNTFTLETGNGSLSTPPLKQYCVMTVSCSWCLSLSSRVFYAYFTLDCCRLLPLPPSHPSPCPLTLLPSSSSLPPSHSHWTVMY